MEHNYDRSSEYTGVHEGGFVNHPRDPGGATNHGVTIGTLSGWLGRPATVADVRNLSRATAKRIFRANYWKPAGCDDLPLGIDYAVFDYAVNSGVSKAVKDLQRTLGDMGRKVTVDGICGTQTKTAAAKVEPNRLITEYCKRRMRFLRSLEHWDVFGRGWRRRVMGQYDGVQSDDHGVIDRACRMAADLRVELPKTVDDGAHAKAPEPKGLIAVILSILRSIFR